jgi:hypothetical protein
LDEETAAARLAWRPCARDTVSAIKAAGFAVERVRTFALGPSWLVTNPHVLGVAHAPDGPERAPAA